MITVNLKGGLCNQLFQIFAAISVAIKNGHRFIFTYDTHLYTGITRPTYWESFLKALKQFTVANPIYNVNNNMLKNLPVLNCYQHEYKEIPAISKDQNVMLDGYFQSYKYFQKYEETIFSMIRLSQQKKDICEEFPIYCKSENTYNISMHFRLGDYKYVQHSHNILPFDYYKKSLAYILDNLTNEISDTKKIRVLFFCEKEDNEYVFSQIKLLQNEFPSVEFIKIDDNIPDWKQMLIMSVCDSCIIANSTFSWWGAYFNNCSNMENNHIRMEINENKDKMVTYPSVWFGPNLSRHKLHDMFPSGWKKIDI